MTFRKFLLALAALFVVATITGCRCKTCGAPGAPDVPASFTATATVTATASASATCPDGTRATANGSATVTATGTGSNQAEAEADAKAKANAQAQIAANANANANVVCARTPTPPIPVPPAPPIPAPPTPSACTYNVTALPDVPAQPTNPANPTRGSFTIGTAPNCSWSVTVNAFWVGMKASSNYQGGDIPVTSGSGANTSVYYVVANNTSGAARAATFTVKFPADANGRTEKTTTLRQLP